MSDFCIPRMRYTDFIFTIPIPFFQTELVEVRSQPPFPEERSGMRLMVRVEKVRMRHRVKWRV